jgi:isoleucyl-tRNA synthetase
LFGNRGENSLLQLLRSLWINCIKIERSYWKRKTATSVHLTDFPKVNESLIDQNLVEKTFGKPSHLWFLFEKERKRESSSATSKSDDSCFGWKTEEQILAVSELIKQEVNVKELQLINAEEASHLIVKQIN